MVMPHVDPWTREDVLALPDDGNRYELFDGELLVTPSPAPRHQAVVSFLIGQISPYLRAQNLGFIYTSPGDLSLDGNQLAQPDLFVIPGPTIGNLRWEDLPTPTLVIEVLSPATARYDRQIKRRWYQRTGIPEYWIVDPDARVVERWRPEDARPEVLDQSLAWQPQSDREALVMDLAGLFTEALGPA